MLISNDPLNDYETWDAWQNARDKRPICEICDERINDREAFHYCGKWICLDCVHRYTEETE